MPTINNATVATGTGLSVNGNGGRKIARLSNGNLVTVIKDTSNNLVRIHSSTNKGLTWSEIATDSPFSGLVDATIAVFGNRFIVTVVYSGSTVWSRVFESDGTKLNGYTVDSSAYAGGMISSAINSAGNEIHLTWSSRSSIYSNSYNIKYAKGTIRTDGTISWNPIEQVTFVNTSGYDYYRPSLILLGNVPYIFFDYAYPTYPVYIIGVMSKGLLSKELNDTSTKSDWGSKIIETGSTTKFSTSPLFVPQSINGLTNGRIWVSWHAKDSVDTAKFNVRTSYSDDAGVTWTTQTKHTSGNAYDQQNTSLTSDSFGKVFLMWDSLNATTTQTGMRIFNGTSWGATSLISGSGFADVSSLLDGSNKMGVTIPPMIRRSSSGIYFSGDYIEAASITPASSALGDKTASSVLSYTVTPESGSTVTSIVEKVNGTTVNTYSNPASLSRTFTIPLANWDALKYYNTHTISVTVTDNNGMTNTQTYTFNKVLANDASLLEGAKAAKDGKDRISTKRDALAGQVGAPPGSTFDAISAAISSNTMKVTNETGTISITTTSNKLTVNNLTYRPKYVIISAYYGSYAQTVVLADNNLIYNTSGAPTAVARGVAGGTTSFETTTFGSRFSITDNGFSAELIVSGTTGGTANYKWIAIG